MHQYHINATYYELGVQLGAIAHVHLGSLLSVGSVDGVVVEDRRELLQRFGRHAVEPVDRLALDDARVVMPDLAPSVHVLLTLHSVSWCRRQSNTPYRGNAAVRLREELVRLVRVLRVGVDVQVVLR